VNDAVGIPGFHLGAVLNRSGPDRRGSIEVRVATRAVDDAVFAVKTIAHRYPRLEQAAELRREFDLLDRLRTVEGVVQVETLERYGNGNLAIVMELGGRSSADVLADRRAPLTVAEFLPFAMEAARALGGVHEHGVVHKGIQPANVLVDEHFGSVRLVDFSAASELSGERQSEQLAGRVESMFPYMSPEQTGRMNRTADHRSDLYSLGVLFFELLTGSLPYEAEHRLDWVHCHVAQPTPSSHGRNPAVPRAVAAVLQKLMAKNAEDRYQSAYGLVADLRRCAEQLHEKGEIVEFSLGLDDVSPRFGIPSRLYGRDAEFAELFTSFELAAAGGNEFVLVAGESGIGKTALVNELSASLVREGGYLVQGKFDQFQSNSAYSALASAFGQLVVQVMAEQPAWLSEWRAELLDALHGNGRALTDVVPEVAELLGPQPALPELPPTEARNRFQIVFGDFVRTFVRRHRTLVVFLDDLQWSDGPTLTLVQQLIGSRSMPHLLLIGAYRSNEVDAGHPLRLALDEIGRSAAVNEMVLEPLAPRAVVEMVADTLHCDPDDAGPLADVLHTTAAGSPFFIVQLFRNLHDEDLLRFDATAGRWTWSVDEIRRAGISNDVAEFMAASLRRLPPATQDALQLAACIGNTFDLHTLVVIGQLSTGDAASALESAVRRNVLVPLDDDYRLVGSAVVQSRLVDGGDDDVGLNPRYAFGHDRVQQAAYELIDPDRQRAVHLSIGRLMQRDAADTGSDEQLISIVDHLNRGRTLITDDDERLALAESNLRAGGRAKRSSAYDSALEFLGVGLEMLGADGWLRHYELTMSLTREHQQCAYLTARYDVADRCADDMLTHARDSLTVADIRAVQTRQFATLGRMDDSIRAAISGLRELGVQFPDRPDQHDVDREAAITAELMRGREVEELLDSPELTDEADLVTSRLLMEIFAAAFLSASGDLFPFLVLKSVNLSIAKGNSPEAAFSYAAYGMLLCGALGQPRLGHRYGLLGVAVNERFDDVTLRSRVIYLYAMFIHHWNEHWSTMTPWFRRGIEAGYRSGDLLYLAYNAQDCIIWDPGLDLETAAEQHRTYMEIVRDCEYRDSFDSGTLFLQMQRCQLGRTIDDCSLTDDSFDELAVVEGMRARRFMTGIANFHIYKAEVAYFHGRPDVALEHVREQDRLVGSVMSLPQLVRYRVTSMLTLARVFDDLDEVERAETLTRFDRDIAEMRAWADNCPVNFRHIQTLMEGERERVLGRDDAAVRHFEAAALQASEGGFLRDAAMANELAVRALVAQNRPRAAIGYLHDALHLYERWGAHRKVELLTAEFAELHADRVDLVPGGRSDAASLDVEAVIRASQAISGELVVEDLWATTLPLLLASTGAQRGCLVVRRDGIVAVEAQAVASDDDDAPPFGAGGDIPTLPMSVLSHVLRTAEPVVINSEADRGRFARDPYLDPQRASGAPKSLICVPLTLRGRFDGAIYLENRLATDVFTEDRAEVIRLLAAQAMISLDNAELYQEQVRLIDAQRRFVPRQFLESLGHEDIALVGQGQYVAREMSVLFADLRDFTPIAERMEPEDLVELVNRYFVSIEPAITDEGGFIDSFRGDEIMALFDVSADQALRAGIGLCRALERFNADSVQRGSPVLDVGAGINSGPLVLGTVGTHTRVQCTVMGDTVNAAARIEQLTKTYRTHLLVGEGTVERLREPDAFSLRLLDRVMVKGKAQALDVYEVLDAEPEPRRLAKQRTRGLLSEVVAAHRAGAFADVVRLVDEARVLDPLDAVWDLYAQRARTGLTPGGDG
jgi:predicted ATPase/class 3 adenylate cyclase